MSLRIHDLSLGGCLVDAHYDQPSGKRIKIEVQLPYEGWMELEAETLDGRPGIGFAVSFVNMDEATRDRLQRVITRMLEEGSGTGDRQV